MNVEGLRELANAVLYEGYLLYPYRHSAIKNRRRWNFGMVYPRAYSVAHGGGDPWTMRTECLVQAQPAAMIHVTVRFLHLLTCRRTAARDATTVQLAFGGRFVPESWEEGMEREVVLAGLAPDDLLTAQRQVAFDFPGGSLTDEASNDAQPTVREQVGLAGRVVVSAECCAVSVDGLREAGDEIYKLTLQVENVTACPEQDVRAWRDNDALPRSFVSTHAILQVTDGAFISLMDPPEALRDVAASCRNQRVYPVLIGDEGRAEALLASPIALYDYPRIASESAGALFDGTEIDEILTLRILTLTDDEKAEIRAGDERARAILERTESLTAEQLMRMHGALRDLQPVERDATDGAPGEGGRV
jgi:hypothetical protein